MHVCTWAILCSSVLFHGRYLHRAPSLPLYQSFFSVPQVEAWLILASNRVAVGAYSTVLASKSISSLLSRSSWYSLFGGFLWHEISILYNDISVFKKSYQGAAKTAAALGDSSFRSSEKIFSQCRKSRKIPETVSPSSLSKPIYIYAIQYIGMQIIYRTVCHQLHYVCSE